MKHNDIAYIVTQTRIVVLKKLKPPIIFKQNVLKDIKRVVMILFHSLHHLSTHPWRDFISDEGPSKRSHRPIHWNLYGSEQGIHPDRILPEGESRCWFFKLSL